jgi:hypothetical protein
MARSVGQRMPRLVVLTGCPADRTAQLEIRCRGVAVGAQLRVELGLG